MFVCMSVCNISTPNSLLTYLKFIYKCSKDKESSESEDEESSESESEDEEDHNINTTKKFIVPAAKKRGIPAKKTNVSAKKTNVSAKKTIVKKPDIPAKPAVSAKKPDIPPSKSRRTDNMSSPRGRGRGAGRGIGIDAGRGSGGGGRGFGGGGGRGIGAEKHLAKKPAAERSAADIAAFQARVMRLAIATFILLQANVLKMAKQEGLSYEEALAALVHIGLGHNGAIGGIADSNSHLLGHFSEE